MAAWQSVRRSVDYILPPRPNDSIVNKNDISSNKSDNTKIEEGWRDYFVGSP